MVGMGWCLDSVIVEVSNLSDSDPIRGADGGGLAVGRDESRALSPPQRSHPCPLPPVPQWYVQATCATQGTGLYDGLDWLSHELSKR